jgi:hypothetical protein
MPTETVIVVVAIVAVFAIFSGVLSWAEMRTNQTRKTHK